MGQGPTWTPAQREARLAKLVERNRAKRSGSVPYEDREWLRSRYEDQRLTLRQIAVEANCGLRTIARWMSIHDIPRRTEWKRATGAANSGWERGGDDISYQAVHVRLKLRRGAASAHCCEHCGDQAREWSYDKTDPHERHDARGPYSLDLTRYVPLCVKCHRRFDAARRGVRGEVPHATPGR